MRTGIALGSNLGDRLAALTSARAAVLEIRGVSTPLLCSSVYETEPVDSAEDAGAFLNAVIEVHFEGAPADLLRGLQNIEENMGRPKQRPINAPRIADLDILYFGTLTVATSALVIPHPRLHLRRFVLQPLAQIRPHLTLPGQSRTTSGLLHDLADPAAVSLASEQWTPCFASAGKAGME